jgi:hypothetical protein
LRYRTKLLLVFLAVALGTNGLSLFVMDRLALHYLYESYRAKLLSITASTAVLLDGDLLDEVHSRTDENSPAYLQLRQTLRRLRDANHRPDTQMKRVFTVMPPPATPPPSSSASTPKKAAVSPRIPARSIAPVPPSPSIFPPPK